MWCEEWEIFYLVYFVVLFLWIDVNVIVHFGFMGSINWLDEWVNLTNGLSESWMEWNSYLIILDFLRKYLDEENIRKINYGKT
jgi:hypothetical protein